MTTNGRAWVDHRAFLVIDGIKVCKVTPAGLLEFKDKDRARSRERGTEFVIVDLEEIRAVLQSAFVRDEE